MVVRDPEGKRELILEKALLLFTEKGFHGTPVPQIAEAAGIGAGTIYRSFSGKEELVNVLFQRWKGRFNDCLQDRFPQQSTPREKFFHLWNQMADFQRTNPMAFRFLEFHSHAPYLDENSIRMEESSHRFLSVYFEEAVKSGAIVDLPVATLIGFCYGSFVGLVKYQEILRRVPDTNTIRMGGELCWAGIQRR